MPPKQHCVGITYNVNAFGGVLAVSFGKQVLWPDLTPYQIMQKVTIALKMGTTGTPL